MVERHRKCTGCGRDVDSVQDVEERHSVLYVVERYRECIGCGRELNRNVSFHI